MSHHDLASRQAALVAALVVGGPIPTGFPAERVRAAAAALLRKRAAEAGRAWPMLRASLGPRWTEVFASWAGSRAYHGPLADGFYLAQTLAARGALSPPAAEELAAREVLWREVQSRTVRSREVLMREHGAALLRRRLPCLRQFPGGLVLQVSGRVLTWRRRGHQSQATGVGHQSQATGVGHQSQASGVGRRARPGASARPHRG